MDRDTVRMILLVLGVIVVAGVYIWGRYRDTLLDFINRRGDFDELDYSADTGRHAEGKSFERESRRLEPDASDLHIIPSDNTLDGLDLDLTWDGLAPSPAVTRKAETQSAKDSPPLGAPFLIQLSVVARDDGFFNGEDLRDALVDLNLVYGDMGIYHRYDREFREPLFSVASLVEPGTFPIDDMGSFECPGVVMFFQPTQVRDPLAVYDDLVGTCHELAMKLDGIEWDETRKPATDEKIAQMRERLEEAY